MRTHAGSAAISTSSARRPADARPASKRPQEIEQLRRDDRNESRIETEHGFVIDAAARRIRINGRELPLTPLEYQLLKLLLSSPERVYSRDQLLDALHDDFRDVSDRAVDSHVKNLRKKIDAVSPGLQCIGTVYGVGYRYES